MIDTSSHSTDLYPLPFALLVTRLAREIEHGREIYGMRRSSWWTPVEGRDLSIEHVGGRIGTPVGPASGPHTQLAHNLVLSWLGGGRFMELKTVQVLDELEIPRPCIHVPNLGFNVEWSQELRVHQSALEYVKGWMLIHIIADKLDLWPGPETIFDMSLGYDLAGIKSDKVGAFIHWMKDASELIERLRGELPAELRDWADVPVPAQVSNSTTLSTFHGCPADEIEAIATFAMREHGLHTVVKLNPTLLGYERCRHLVHDVLGYEHIALRPEPFEEDLHWDQLMDLVPRLQAVAAEEGVTLGFKFTNNLVMSSPQVPFEGTETYMSGTALHVLAMTLASEFRQATAEDIPITFSAGVNASNFADCVAAGLGPVTTSSDLLKSKGYGRLPRYLRNLEREMGRSDAENIESYRSVTGSLAELAAGVQSDERYRHSANLKPPKKVGSHLELFDCLTCDLCIPVCPNAANFSYPAEKGTYSPGRLSWDGAEFTLGEGEELVIEKRHQIGCTAELCNLCGECDVWCPEDGGPYLVKPNLFVSAETFEEHPERDGFLVAPDRQGITWRRGGEILTYRIGANGTAVFESPGGRVVLENDAPVETAGEGEVDLTVVVSMKLILDGLSQGWESTWLPPTLGS